MKSAASAVLFAAALGGCAVPPPAAQEIYGQWVIEQARSEPILDKRRARLVLERDGRLSGHNSCNAMTARFERSGDGSATPTAAVCCAPRAPPTEALLRR